MRNILNETKYKCHTRIFPSGYSWLKVGQLIVTAIVLLRAKKCFPVAKTRKKMKKYNSYPSYSLFSGISETTQLNNI